MPGRSAPARAAADTHGGDAPYCGAGAPLGGDQEAEIRRLEALGAKAVTVSADGVDWSVMEDPEGNGFSVYTPCG